MCLLGLGPGIGSSTKQRNGDQQRSEKEDEGVNGTPWSSGKSKRPFADLTFDRGYFCRNSSRTLERREKATRRGYSLSDITTPHKPSVRA